MHVESATRETAATPIQTFRRQFNIYAIRKLHNKIAVFIGPSVGGGREDRSHTLSAHLGGLSTNKPL